jgi:hypothetical protein
LDDFSSATPDEPAATRQAVPNYYAIQDVQLLSDAAAILGLRAQLAF